MAIFADDIKRIAMSAELARTLSRAAEYANAQSHDQIQLEHLLLALTEDQDAAIVLTASHVDANLLKADVSQYLGGLTERIVTGAGWPTVAPDLKRILEAAAAAAQHGRRPDINGAIVLAAIIGDGRSPAAHMLRAQGLTFDEAIKALQRAMAQPPAAQTPAPQIANALPAPAAVPAAGAEDILAAARERIRRSRGIEAPAAPTNAAGAASTHPEPESDYQPVGPEPSPTRTEQQAAPPQLDYDPGPGEPEPVDEPAGYDEGQYEPAADVYAGIGHDADTLGPLADIDAAEPPRDDCSSAHEVQPYQAHYGAEAAAAPEPVPPYTPRPHSRPPEPGTRWPQPVAPAWRDAETGPPAAFATEPVPPPLPYDAPGPQLEAPDAFATSYHTAGDAPQWDAPQGYPAEYWPQGVHPQPFAHEAQAGGFDTPQHLEPSFSDPTAGAVQDTAGHDAGPAPIGPAVLLEGPSSRPRRARKQTEAVARALGQGLPRRLRLGLPVGVESRMAKSEIFALASALSGTPGRAPQPGLAMSVRLRAPEGGIIIDAASSETHWFETRPDVIQSETAHWQWTVTAVEPGWKRLQLIAAVRATGADGVTGDHMLPDTVVEVRVRRGAGRVLGGLFKWAIAIALGAAAGYSWADLLAAAHKLIK